MIKIFIALLLILLVNAQNNLTVGNNIKVTLKANQPRTYTLLTNTTHNTNNTDLLVIADPLLEIPNQIPDIEIKSNGTALPCFTASNEMEGVCRIESTSIKK